MVSAMRRGIEKERSSLASDFGVKAIYSAAPT